MDKQQLEAIRARDADDYAAADVLRNIRSAGNTDPELEATINMIADRRDLLAAYDALAVELSSVKAARDVFDGTACAEERASGAGPCGMCVQCLRARLAEAELLLDSAAHVIVDHGCSEISAAWIEQWGDRYEKFTSETVTGSES